MKSRRTVSPVGFLMLALLGACLSTATASGQGFKVRSSNWDNLKSLTPGQKIRVVMNNLISYEGKFESLSDGGIRLRQAGGEQILARKDIFRVSEKKGHNHQVRNMLIGMAVGAGAGLVIGLGPYYVKRNCTEGPEFNCGSPPNPHRAEVLTPLGSLAGTALGAAMPRGGWHDVYRAH